MDYVIKVATFALSEDGPYTCTVETNWWKDDSTEVSNSADDSVELTYGTLIIEIII